MTDAPLMKRIAAAIQTQHESTQALQALAQELADHCARMRGLAGSLSAAVTDLDSVAQGDAWNSPALDLKNMPKILRGGPTVRDAG